MEDNVETTAGGIGLGNVIAVCVSWSATHSILWALLHGICGWFYLIYHWVIG